MKTVDKKATYSRSTALLYSTPIVVFPFLRDPFNLPKFLWISIFAVVSSILLIKRTWRSGRISSVNKTVPLMFFLLAWTAASIVNFSSGLEPMLLGEYGRLAGIIPVTSLILATVVHHVRVSEYPIRVIIVTLFNCGNAYAAWTISLAFFGSSFEENSLYRNQIQGLGGNINFTGALLSISIVSGLFLLASKEKSNGIKNLLVIVSVTFQGIALSISPSLLALMSIAIGTFLSLIQYFAKIDGQKRRKVLILFVFIALNSILLSSFGGQLRQEISSSLRPRIVFWKITFRVFLEHPIFGIGPDRLGDYYVRTGLESGVIFESSMSTTNSAHNFLLDVLAMSGIVGFVSVCVFFMVTCRSYLRALIKSGVSENSEISRIFIIWVIVLVQSLLIPIAIWHLLLLLGLPLVFGGKSLERNENTIKKPGYFEKRHNKIEFVRTKQIRAVLLASVTIASISSFFAISSNVNDVEFRKAMSTGNLQKLEQAVSVWPTFDDYLELSIRAMVYSNLPTPEIDFARKLVKNNPLSTKGWETILNSTISSTAEKNEARLKLHEKSR